MRRHITAHQIPKVIVKHAVVLIIKVETDSVHTCLAFLTVRALVDGYSLRVHYGCTLFKRNGVLACCHVQTADNGSTCAIGCGNFGGCFRHYLLHFQRETVIRKRFQFRPNAVGIRPVYKDVDRTAACHLCCAVVGYGCWGNG